MSSMGFFIFGWINLNIDKMFSKSKIWIFKWNDKNFLNDKNKSRKFGQ